MVKPGFLHSTAKRRNRLVIKGLLLFLSVIFLAGCTQTAVTPDALNPQGPGAARIAQLWWLLASLGSLTYLLVVGLLGWALWRKRKSIHPASSEETESPSQRFIIGGGVLFPAVILLIVFGATLSSLVDLNNIRQEEYLLIEVVGHQWWWEINYPHQQFSTANEIHIPVGEPVQFRLNSADVIHSFWVPELHGKLDLIPGRTNTLWLQADEPGQYWGLCAEFCGIQHAKMLLVVVAEPRAAFDEWMTAQRATAVSPATSLTEQGRTVFMETGCAECHTIRGTQALGTLGPDLTHFADRLTLGAGIALNTRGNLSAWVVDPHDMKEANLMPATTLTDDELTALLAYLESLE